MMKNLIIENRMFKKHLINGLILLPFIWLSTGIYFTHNSDKTMVFMTIISIITSLTIFKFKVVKNNFKNNRFIWLLIIILSYNLFSYFYNGISSQEIRTLTASILLLGCFPYNILTKKNLSILTIIGTIFGFIGTCYFSKILHLQRDQWPVNAIPFSTIVATYLVFSLVLFLHTKSRKIKITMLMMFIINISSLILSETRGAILAASIAIIFILASELNLNKINLKVVAISIVVIFGMFFILKKPIDQRIDQTAVEYHKIESGNLTSSVGLRLQMWEIAPKLIENNIILGLGKEHLKKLDQLYFQGLISKQLYEAQTPHYHNQYIDKIIKTGLIGLVLFLSLLIIPVFLLRKKNIIYQQLSIGIIITFSIASLTDVPFNHGQTLFIYLLFIGFFYTSSLNKEKVK